MKSIPDIIVSRSRNGCSTPIINSTVGKTKVRWLKFYYTSRTVVLNVLLSAELNNSVVSISITYCRWPPNGLAVLA
jgi:hypothetical protein